MGWNARFIKLPAQRLLKWGARGREFESRRPDHFFPSKIRNSGEKAYQHSAITSIKVPKLLIRHHRQFHLPLQAQKLLDAADGKPELRYSKQFRRRLPAAMETPNDPVPISEFSGLQTMSGLSQKIATGGSIATVRWVRTHCPCSHPPQKPMN